MSLEAKFTASYVENIPIAALVFGRFTPRSSVDATYVNSIANQRLQGQMPSLHRQVISGGVGGEEADRE